METFDDCVRAALNPGSAQIGIGRSLIYTKYEKGGAYTHTHTHTYILHCYSLSPLSLSSLASSPYPGSLSLLQKNLSFHTGHSTSFTRVHVRPLRQVVLRLMAR
jgi:hypothetical protein